MEIKEDLEFKSLERLTLKNRLQAEKRAMDWAIEVLGLDVMRQWGGWWRNRFRENPSKFERVLNAVRSDLREGKVMLNRGGYAYDTWLRFADK